MELEETGFLISDHATKPLLLKHYGTGTETEM